MTAGVRITNVIGRRGRVMATGCQVTLEGGPELAVALTRLDDAVRIKAAQDALQAAGGVIAMEWQHRVPVLDATDLHEIARLPTPDGVSDRTFEGFSADGKKADVLTYRPAKSELPVIQLLDVATGTLNDSRFGPHTRALLPLRP